MMRPAEIVNIDLPQILLMRNLTRARLALLLATILWLVQHLVTTHGSQVSCHLSPGLVFPLTLAELVLL